MTHSPWLLTALAAACTAVANLSLRAGVLRAGGFEVSRWRALLAQPWFLLGFGFYGLAALIWFRVLSIAEVSATYPVLVSATFVLVAVGSYFVFREQISFLRVAGMLVILAGIAIMTRS